MEEKSTKNRRNNFSPEEKVAILKKHLVDRKTISDLCEEYGIQPTQFYSWQKTFFENGASAFKSCKKGENKFMNRKMEEYKDKLRRKDEVLAELMEEHIKLKKSLGEI